MLNDVPRGEQTNQLTRKLVRTVTDRPALEPSEKLCTGQIRVEVSSHEELKFHTLDRRTSPTEETKEATSRWS